MEDLNKLAEHLQEKRKKIVEEDLKNLTSMRESVRSLISENKFDEAVAFFRNNRFTLGDCGKEIFKEVQKPCPKCQEGFVYGFFDGFSIRWSQMCSSCHEQKQLEEDQEQARKKKEAQLRRKNYFYERTEDIMKQCGIPSLFLTARMEDFGNNFKIPATGLFLCGNRGTGKTHLAAAIIRQAILDYAETDENYKDTDSLPLFVSVPNLLLQIRESFKDTSQYLDFKSKPLSEMEIIEKYSEIPLLVLDDLGAEKSSEWSIQTLYTIIDRRYGEMKRTVFTSNLTLKDISIKLDDRISSRIAGMCEVFTLKGSDRRLRRG